jgi:tetratricopeptide (TPR) repeat protein
MIMKRVLALVSLVSLIGCTHPAMLPPKAVQLNDEGARALAAGDYVTAEARVALALEYNEKFTEAWTNKGLIEYKRGFYGEARKDLLHARHLNPDLPTPHHGLGLVSEAENKLPEAEKHYVAALKVDPGFAPARVNLGRLMFQRHAFDEARDQFFKLTEVAPDSLDGWLGLIESLIQLEQEEEATAQVELAVRRFGEQVGRLNVLRARLQINDGKYAYAESLLVAATQDSDPLYCANAWAWLSVARLALNNVSASVYAAQEATRIDPTNTVGRYALEQATGAAVEHASRK